MENNVDQKNSKVLSEVDLAEDSSKDGYKQNDQPKTTLPKTENWIKETYKKLSKSCEKLPPLIRKNSNDGLFLNRSISSKTFTEHFNSTEHKNSKKYQTLDIMKIKDGGNVDETKDNGTPTRPSITEIINNAGLPSLFSHTLPADFFKPKYFHKGFSEISLESSVQKPGSLHSSIDKADNVAVTGQVNSKEEQLSNEQEISHTSGTNISRSLNRHCGYLRLSSSLNFSCQSSSGSSSSSSSSSLSLSSPRDSFLSQSLNSGQHREKQLRKNTQNLKQCLSHDDISKTSCLSQPLDHEKNSIVHLCPLRISQTCDKDIKKEETSSENLESNNASCLKDSQSVPSEINPKQTDSENKDLNAVSEKHSSPQVLVLDQKTNSEENIRISECKKQESITKQNLTNKPTPSKPHLTEMITKNLNSQNQTDLLNSNKPVNKHQKIYRPMTTAKTENLSSRNETQRQLLQTLQKKPNHKKSASSLRPKDVGVCISSVMMHKRSERNVSKQPQNKDCTCESKPTESRKLLSSESSKRHHNVRMAPSGENKPLLDILAQRTQTVSVTKLDSCVKIENMFENFRDRKNEPLPSNKVVNKRQKATESTKIVQSISGSLSSKPNCKQEARKNPKSSIQKKFHEKESKNLKISKKQPNKTKRKNAQQSPAKLESEEDLHTKLSSNVALISGRDWHIVTDCMDVSNVKVANKSTNIYQDYSFAKGFQDDGEQKNDGTNHRIEGCQPALFNNLINEEKEENKNILQLTTNVENYSSNRKLSLVDESPETLKLDKSLRNNNWMDTAADNDNDKSNGETNAQSEDLLPVPDTEHRCNDLVEDLSWSKDIPENLDPTMSDNNSDYDTDFECLSGSDFNCDEDLDLPNSENHELSASSPQPAKPEEVNQDNLDLVVEELLNYSTSPVCPEKHLSNISLPESDSILLKSIKYHKNSPFYAQSKCENDAVEDKISMDAKENSDVLLENKFFHRSLKSQDSDKHTISDGLLSDEELESLVQLEDLNKKQSQFCRQDSASTTSSFLSIGEDFTWKKGDLLGSGSYGKVWRGLTSDGKQIAVKQIVLDLTDREKAEREYQKVQEEVEILKTLQHKNIVSFLGMRREGEEVSIFMQYVTGGSIAQLLARFGPLDEPVFCSYTQQILEGVKYLHDKNVIHRDIKGGNVMLMPNSTIKLVDFGCAKRLCYNLSKNSFYNPTSLQGTPYWMAPEVVQETGHGKKSDIWSIGCTVFEMATKSPPWSDMNPYAAIFAICSSKPVPKLPSEFSQKAQDFVRVCLIRDPTERPTANELLQDKFITTPHHGRRRKSMTCFN